MPSPFPGIDPFIEGQLWSDFHARFIAALSEDLMPKVRPRYVAVIEERIYLESDPEQPRVHYRPDVTIASELSGGALRNRPPALSAAPIQVPLPVSDPAREVFIELRLGDSRELVGVIELLSPSNKRSYGDGRREYLSKRQRVISSRVHLVELDLLRGGVRLPMGLPLPRADGYAIVSNSRRYPTADVWPVSLRQPLPTIAIPLADEDPDVSIDLQAVFQVVYDRAGYDYLLRYDAPIEPPLSAEDAAWAKEILAGQT